jgi:uncharacterized protein (DUF486 family)
LNVAAKPLNSRVFAGFSVLYLKEPITWNQGVGFSLIAAGAFFVFHKW